METPQDRGRAFDDEVASIVGGRPIPGSGNGIYKLDAGSQSLVWSCKHTDDKSIRITGSMMQEMRDATTGIGGIGEAITPILVARFAKVELVTIMGFTDLVRLLKEDVRPIPATKDEQRRSAASGPTLLRDE